VMKRETAFAEMFTTPSVFGDAVRVDVALAEALHLDQPAPRELRARSCSCARRRTLPSRSAHARDSARTRRRAARRAGCRTSA
jgi:hypothetical protein